MTNNDKAGRRNMSGNKLHEIIYGGVWGGGQSTCPLASLYRGATVYVQAQFVLRCTKQTFETVKLEIHVNIFF
jgi:hypothetical protein